MIISERSLASDRAVFAATQLAGADRDAYDLAYATIDLPAVAATADRAARVSRRGTDAARRAAPPRRREARLGGVPADARGRARARSTSVASAGGGAGDVARDVVGAINAAPLPTDAVADVAVSTTR